MPDSIGVQAKTHTGFQREGPHISAGGAEQHELTRKGGGDGDGSSSSFVSARILVAEDNEFNMEV